MLLKEYLMGFTKEKLLDEARSFELRKYSGLRKAELIDKIVDSFCSEEMIRSRFACLTKEQLDLFKLACVTPQDISICELMDIMQLNRYWITYFDDLLDKFLVFEDVAAVFPKIDDDAFRADWNRKGWMIKCIQFFTDYYGIAPIEIIYKMYSQKIKCTIDEMMDMLWGMPMDILNSCIFTMDQIGMRDWPKDDPIYSKKGLFVHLPLLEDKAFEYLTGQQMDKAFYIPSIHQIDEIYRFGYEASALAYKNLESFLMKSLSFSYGQAFSWCRRVWVNNYKGESPADIINAMSKVEIVFSSEKMLNELMQLLMLAYNNTRMKENRGHKPTEISRKNLPGRMPTIVPTSSHAAAILRDAGPKLQAMGIPFDLNGNADPIHACAFPQGLNGEAVYTEKKIYPNDSCFCGSGKKYKKCCGRKN